jgi:hypothetical protein
MRVSFDMSGAMTPPAHFESSRSSFESSRSGFEDDPPPPQLVRPPPRRAAFRTPSLERKPSAQRHHNLNLQSNRKK